MSSPQTREHIDLWPGVFPHPFCLPLGLNAFFLFALLKGANTKDDSRSSRNTLALGSNLQPQRSVFVRNKKCAPEVHRLKPAKVKKVKCPVLLLSIAQDG